MESCALSALSIASSTNSAVGTVVTVAASPDEVLAGLGLVPGLCLLPPVVDDEATVFEFRREEVTGLEGCSGLRCAVALGQVAKAKTNIAVAVKSDSRERCNF